MPALTLAQKLTILADAAKYDASCASSGAKPRHSLGGRGVGSTEGNGICHAFTPDGRCVSLLKILLTNACVFDCAYCINRASSNVPRARFTVDEVVTLTLDFYKRNYIEGLFLSSGIIRSADYTMDQLVRVVRTLRRDHDFRGYIHLKTIPDADPALMDEAGRYADRLSINVELPSEASLSHLAPGKQMRSIRRSMGLLRLKIDEGAAARKESSNAPRFAPAGQSTQMIVGADAACDIDVLRSSDVLYASYGLRRVYYSAFSPIPQASATLPVAAPPLMREHRLYQGDWLLRYYGFSIEEIASAAPGGMFDPAIDPKLAWALANRAQFPLDINHAPRELLLRVPGLGMRIVDRILAARRIRAIRIEDLFRLTKLARKALPFVVAPGWSPGALTDDARLIERFRPPAQQLDLFAAQAQ